MHETVSVSPTAPDKLVVNGVDLLNRSELSSSQNKELQRYIDTNAHLLGYLDKEKQEQESRDAQSAINKGSYPTSSMDHLRKPLTVKVEDTEFSKRFEQPVQNYSPTSSDYSGKRKGVSWSDADQSRARSYSPVGPPAEFKNPNFAGVDRNGYGQPPQFSSDYGQPQPISSDYGRPSPRNMFSSLQPYSGNDAESMGKGMGSERATSYDPYARPKSWGNSWLDGSNENISKNEGYGYRGFPKQIVPTYSTLERNKDDYNKFETYRFREQQGRRSREKDDVIRFGGYGDHRSSGVCEPKPIYWQGGESPIGDGVVAADGVELKRLPPDLNPKVSVINQKIVEPGDPGRQGIKITEKTWDEGSGPKDDRGLHESYTPWGGDGGRRPADDGRRPADDGGRNKDKFPVDDFDGGARRPLQGPPQAGLGNIPNVNYPDDDGRGDRGYGGSDNGPSRPDSGLSIGSDGLPREGWTKTFIVNPRECINIYGSEMLTTIFDLEDHTPKTMVTVKETFSPARDIDIEDEAGATK